MRILLALCLAAGTTRAAEPFEIVIRGGRIVDGTGAPWYVADIGIRAGRIVEIGRIADAGGARVLEAEGLVVAPGFVDLMGQTASPLLEDPATALNLLTQGITTINAGEGDSAAPLPDGEAERAGWTTLAEYFQLLELKGLPLNVTQTVGHTQVRRLVLGDSDREPSAGELERMRELVCEAMEAGAIGVSTALIYPPAVYAGTEEIAALAAVAGDHGGRYYTHMRNEGDRLLEAIDEALEIGRRGNTPVHIFHLKAAGRQNWGKMQLALARIKAARASGQEVTADIYPYINNGLGIAAFVHPRHFSAGRAALLGRLADPALRAEIRTEMEETGGWENWFRHVDRDWHRVVIGQTGDERYREFAGQTIGAMAEARGEDPWDTFFHLLSAGAFALPESMTEANKILAMQEPFVSFSTDVGPAAGASSASHPRGYGAFPRLFARYVRDLGAISLERAVAQASAAAANAVLARDRGRIAEGLAADVIVFDGERFADRAVFAKPHELAVGMKFVIVNGELVLDEGKMTGRRPGRVLRGPSFRRETAFHEISAGKVEPRMASFDGMMREFLRRHRVPGAAVAVTADGRLVFARGYGYADVGSREQVTPTSRFRIASISKPITAVAILQLVERNLLALDDKVFEVLDRAAELAGDERADPRLRDITIRHLLEHRGGWDRDCSFDGMFQSVRFAEALGEPAPAGPETVIRAMSGQQLDFAPGERYAYSNYGYCLLGRVIEKLTGRTYEDHVQAEVLAPLGVRGMRIGRTHLGGRQEGEVRYYHPGRGPSVFAANLGEDVPWPYGAWYLEAMDAHGGWIASAVDLARFACAFDVPEKCVILSPASIDAMHARPEGLAGHDAEGKPTPVYYSLGWLNRVVGEDQVNHWHTGSLAGTATILIRRHDGRNFVALLNARVSPHAEHLGREIDELLHAAAAGVTEWPAYDLFEEFFAAESAPGDGN